ncbi:type 1 fimbrial protein [Duffyella gerundensis]|uniref:fimbrial protein n=1 Tax=Duffyella gerundensis TaxID=1619313 RepID=UPI001CE2EA3B|nr:fimbrial protein [Duffyella gerundensis]UCB32301.1 type 1 fimbrial protein [Duffyella gerundensis]
MKNSVKASLVSGLFIAMGTFSQVQAEDVAGGTVRFLGTVVNGACAVDAGDVDKVVQMGQVRVADFNGTAGTPAKLRQDVDIKLLDCDTSVAQTAAVIFKGTGSPGYNGILSAGFGAGAATGVGIQLFDTTGEPLLLNTRSTATQLIDGTNTLHFRAGYISVSDTVTPGNADATATFDITYA